jgi:hypothetical protein
MIVTDAAGRTWKLSRRMSLFAWRPRWRWFDDVPDLSGGLDFDDGVVMLVAGVVLVALVALLVLPLLLFVAEVALVFALLPALSLGLIVVGLRRHSVVAVCTDDPRQPVHRHHDARSLWQSRRIMRQWARQLRATGALDSPPAA